MKLTPALLRVLRSRSLRRMGRSSPFTDDMVQMLADLGVEPGHMSHLVERDIARRMARKAERDFREAVRAPFGHMEHFTIPDVPARWIEDLKPRQWPRR